MQKNFDAQINFDQLSYGNKIRIRTEEPGFSLIYLIAPLITNYQIQIFDKNNNENISQVSKLKNMVINIKDYCRQKLLEAKQLRDKKISKNLNYILLGDSKLFAIYRQCAITDIEIFDLSAPIMQIEGGVKIYNGDCVYIQADDMFIVHEDGNLIPKQQTQIEGFWIIRQICPVQVQLENCINDCKIDLIKQQRGWVRKHTQRSDIKSSKLILKSDINRDLRKSMNKKYYKIFKGDYEQVKLENEFKYLRMRYQKIIEILRKSLLKKVLEGAIENVNILTQNLKALMYNKIEEFHINDHFINRNSQNLIKKYNIIELLYQIYQLVQKYQGNLFYSIINQMIFQMIELFRLAALQNQQISERLFFVLDDLISRNYDNAVTNQIILLTKNHQTLLNYFHQQRQIGAKNQNLIVPIQYIMERLLAFSDNQSRINCIRILVNACGTQNLNNFLNQEIIFRCIQNQKIGKNPILLQFYKLNQSKKLYFSDKNNIVYELEQLSLNSNLSHEKKFIDYIQIQLHLVSGLCLNNNKQCILYFKKKCKEFAEYMSNERVKENIKLALAKNMLQTQMNHLKQYDINTIKILEDKVQKKFKNQRISFTLQLPKEMIIQQLNKQVFSTLNTSLSKYFKKFEEEFDRGELLSIFSPNLLLNIKLVNQLLLEKNISIKQKQQSMFKKYFKRFFQKINILKKEEKLDESQNNLDINTCQYLDIQVIVRVFLKIFLYNKTYEQHLQKFKVKRNKISNYVHLKDQTIKGIKKLQKMFKKQKLQPNIMLQESHNEEYYHYFKQQINQLYMRYNKAGIIQNFLKVQFKNKELSRVQKISRESQKRLYKQGEYFQNEKNFSSALLQQQVVKDNLIEIESQIKIEICNTLWYFMFAKIEENLNLAFEDLQISFKQNQKFFKKKQKFLLNSYIPDLCLYKIFDKDIYLIMLEQFYLTSDPNLINSILTTLRNLSNYAIFFKQIVSSIIILSERSHCLFYTSIKGLLEYLKQISCSCQNWLRIDLGHHEFYLKQMQICHKLLHSIHVNIKKLISEQQDIKIYQKILYNLDIISILFDLVHYIECLYHSKQELFELEAEQVNLSKQIFRQCLIILNLISYKNIEYQNIIYELFYKNLFQTYSKFPNFDINYFFQAIFQNNSQLLMKITRLQFQIFLSDFIKNAKLFDHILTFKDQRVREYLIYEICDIIIAESKYLKKINNIIEKQGRELQLQKGQRNESVDKQEFSQKKQILLKLIMECLRSQDSFGNKIRNNLSDLILELIYDRVTKDLYYYERYNKKRYDENAVTLKILNLKILVKLLIEHHDYVSKLENYVIMQNYFKSQLLLELNYKNFSHKYFAFYLTKVFPAFIIFTKFCQESFLNEGKQEISKNQQISKSQKKLFNYQILNILQKIIEKQSKYEQILQMIRKQYNDIVFNFSIFSKFFKSRLKLKNNQENFIIIKNDKTQNQTKVILQIFQINIQLIKFDSNQNQQIQTNINTQDAIPKTKTKAEIWNKAVNKLDKYSSPQYIARLYYQKKSVLTNFLNFTTFYDFQQQSLKVTDQLKFIVINEKDMFKKLLSIVLNVRKINLQQQNIHYLLKILKKILVYMYNTDLNNPEIMNFRMVLEEYKNQMNEKEIFDTLLQVLGNDNYGQKIRHKALGIIRLIILKTEVRLNEFISRENEINFIKAIKNQLQICDRITLTTLLFNKKKKSTCLDLIFEIVQKLYEKDIKIPLNKIIIIKQKKYLCLLHLADFIISIQVKVQNLEVHKNILFIIYKYLFENQMNLQKLQKSKLIINQNQYFRCLKKLTVPNENEKLKIELQRLLTVITQNIFSRKINENDQRFIYENIIRHPKQENHKKLFGFI